MTKICELRIQNITDRNNVVVILVNAGYKVSIDEREGEQYAIVIVEV